MRKIHCKHASASEAGDYYQVLFEEDENDDKQYFLIQREFEFGSQTCYVETDDFESSGHFRVKTARLSRNRFYIELADKEQTEYEVTFIASEQDYKEVCRILDIVLSGLNCFTIAN